MASQTSLACLLKLVLMASLMAVAGPIIGQVPPPPPPPPPEESLARDTMLFKVVHHGLMQWVDGCRSGSTEEDFHQRNACEQALLRELLGQQLAIANIELQGSIHLAYIIEKNGSVARVELLEDHTDGQGPQVATAFLTMSKQLRWCCPRARYRPVRLYKTIWVR